MKRKLNNNTGITLISLVITIIILLILVAISIANLIGSGLFEKTRLAKKESENAQIEEEITLGDYEKNINEYLNGTTRENFDMSWKLYQTVIGAVEIDISNLDFQELRIVCTAHRSAYKDNWVLTQGILESDLSTERIDHYMSGYSNGAENYFHINCNRLRLIPSHMKISSTDYISSAVTKVYYR